MRRAVLVLLAAALVLAGCARFRPTPPPDVPKKAPVAVWKRIVTLQYPSAMTISSDYKANHEVAESGHAVVGSERFTITWYLTGELPATVGSSGPAPSSKTQSASMVQATFEATPPGSFETWLEGVEHSRMTVERKSEPALKLGRLTPDGKVAPISPNTVLEAGALTLDFAFDQPMDPAALPRLAQQAEADLMQKRPLQGRTEWLAPDHARWELPQPPAMLTLRTGVFLSKDGLPLKGAGDVALLTPGPTPYVERINVVDGRTERLADVPPDVAEAELSPDAGKLAVRAYEKRGDRQGEFWPTLVQVVSLNTGKATRINIDPFSLTWTIRGDLVSFGTGMYGQDPGWARWSMASGNVNRHAEGNFGRQAPAISPDGTTAVFLRAPVEPPAPPGAVRVSVISPYSLVLKNLETGQEVEVRDFIHDLPIARAGGPRFWPAWSADGSNVLALDPVEPMKWSTLLRYEPKTGRKQVLLERVEVLSFGNRLQLSPDGQRLLVGHQVTSLSGGGAITLPGWGRQAHWAPTGHRILTSLADWDDEVYIYDLETNKQTNFGLGLPVGWHGDWIYIIRWEGSGLRHRYGL